MINTPEVIRERIESLRHLVSDQNTTLQAVNWVAAVIHGRIAMAEDMDAITTSEAAQMRNEVTQLATEALKLRQH